jgi:hypothetical protein
MRPLRLAAPTLLAAICALTSGCGGAATTTRTPAEPSAPVAPALPPSEISFSQQEPWSSLDASFAVMPGFDQRVVQEERSLPGYRPDARYAEERDWSKLCIDVCCASDDRAPDAPADSAPGPLASFAEAQVFGADRTRPLAVFRRADLALVRGVAKGFEHDGRGPIVETVERVRLPFGTHAALVRDGHPYRLTVVVLDAVGRTMLCERIEGDEAKEPIAAQPQPESGWTVTAKAAPTTR